MAAPAPPPRASAATTGAVRRVRICRFTGRSSPGFRNLSEPTVPTSLRTGMRGLEEGIKSSETRLKPGAAAADESDGMTDQSKGIVQAYPEHLSRKAGSPVVGGTFAGAALAFIASKMPG